MRTRSFFALLLFPVLLHGQVTNHFDQPDARWHVAKTYSAATPQNPTFGATTTILYGYQGDSLIGNASWYKLYSTYDSSFTTDLTFEGLIRTDSTMVQYIDTLSQLDTLYDFSLGAGDYVLYPFYGNLYYTSIDAIDSVELNGTFFKVWRFDEPLGLPLFFDYVGERWIEGIGSIHGPLFPHRPRTFTYEILAGDSLILTCSFADGQSVWQHPDYEACYTRIALGTDEEALPEIDVYPNPFTETVTIRYPEKGVYEMTVTSETGRVLLRRRVISGDVIDLAFLSTGMYHVCLSDGLRRRTVKLAKHR